MPAQPSLQRKYVWSALLRLAHWGMAVAVLALLATAWLLYWAPSVAAGASDWHQIAGALLMLALLLRGWLLLTDREAAGWRALVPSKQTVSGILKTAQFYFSLGRMPLPAWYSHNPLWMPIYAIVLVLLMLSALSGFFMQEHPVVLGIYLPTLHKAVAPLIGFFALAHIIAVVMHDAFGGLADVSGMLNGFRLFEIKPTEDTSSGTEQRISLDQISSVKQWRPERKEHD